MATAMELTADESQCVLCCDEIEYSACGTCDHPICLKCCVKLRLLRKEYDCPVCRAQLKEVIVSKGYKSWADKSKEPRRQQRARNYGILHETRESQRKVDELLEHRCLECNELFRTFPQVKDHLRKAHSMMFCDICLRNLKIFTHERRCYTKEELVRHRREGDLDDQSHRGHPLCQFCDERYLDDDELLEHLRKNHFWCHICEKDGNQDYYVNYNDLRRHFKKAHFLCEQAECLHEKFTCVFRLKVDFQAHVTQKHSARLSKAEARQMRQLDFNITFSARDYSFPEHIGQQDRLRETSRVASASTGRDSTFAESRAPSRYKTRDKDRWKETQPSHDPKPEQNRPNDMRSATTEDNRRLNRNNIKSRGVLGDHKRPPGGMTNKETINRKFDSNGIQSNNHGKVSGNSRKGGADNLNSKKDRSVKKKLSSENLVADKNLSLSETCIVNSLENVSTINIQENNVSSLDPETDSRSIDIHKGSFPQSVGDPSLSQRCSDEIKETPAIMMSSVIKSVTNLEDEFPALPADKNQTPVSVAKPKPILTYDSEFPSLLDSPSKAKPNIRQPPGLSRPPSFNGRLVNADQTASDIMVETSQKRDFIKSCIKSEQAQGKTSNPENTVTENCAYKSSKSNKPVKKSITYETEFPTLSTFPNGHKPSSCIKAPPGLTHPTFQPAIPLQPPPGMGWSVPLNMVGDPFAKESRNEKLISNIRRILNFRSQSFDSFRDVSRSYRQGKSSPEQYYRECCELLGNDHVHKVFRELIDLLPDEDKQRQLLLVYNDAKVKAKLQDKTESGTIFNTEKAPFTERTGAEKNEKPVSSGLANWEDDFPALSIKSTKKRSQSAGKVSSAWTREK